MSAVTSPSERPVTGSTLSEHTAAQMLIGRHRLRLWEPLPWLLAIAFYFAFPSYLGFGTDLLIWILFALSLDLALGYAGILTLGHAAFFGAGAYTVGLLAYHGIWSEPLTSLVLAALVAAAIGLASGLVLLRTTGLTLLMLTLCTMALLEEGANMAHEWTGGFDGLPSLTIPPIFGLFEFNPLYPETQYIYTLVILFLGFLLVRALIYSPFGESLTGIRENMLRMHAVGAPVRWRLVVCYTISAAIAGVAGGLWAQTNAYVNLTTLSLDRAATVFIILILGGYGRLYGAFVGAVAYLVLAHFLARLYPTAWQLGLGLLLVVIALFARNGILGIADTLWRRFKTRRQPS
jgi:branched-chain amino acid transport system permease protein